MRVLLVSVLSLTATTAWADAPAFQFVQLTSISREAKLEGGIDDEKRNVDGFSMQASFTADSTFYFPIGLESVDDTVDSFGNRLVEAKKTILSGGVGIRFVTTANSAVFFDYRKLQQRYDDRDDDGYDDSDNYDGYSQRAGWRWMPGDMVELIYMQQRDSWKYESNYTEKTRVIGVRFHFSQSLSVGYQQSELINNDDWDSAKGREIDLRLGF